MPNRSAVDIRRSATEWAGAKRLTTGSLEADGPDGRGGGDDASFPRGLGVDLLGGTAAGGTEARRVAGGG
ncbi:MAG: hypothetical protein QOG97_2762, partial [Acidimicrobiaceae bacterium]|nr:hypothetical protein [Acidimicrobiaceae bacterium]